MTQLAHFKLLIGHAEFRPVGQVSLGEAVELVASAITFARAQQIRKLLVVTLGLTGYAPPAISARYLLMKKWSAAGGASVQVAIVTKPEMVDPQKFGVTVAANHGLTLKFLLRRKRRSLGYTGLSERQSPLKKIC
jgi:hypothetical protein